MNSKIWGWTFLSVFAMFITVYAFTGDVNAAIVGLIAMNACTLEVVARKRNKK